MGKRKRITKKELKHDALLESASKTSRFVEEHLNVLLVVLAVIVVAIVAWSFVNKSRKATELEAGAALTSATQSLASGLYDQAADQYQTVLDEYPGTRSAGSALCHIGQIRFQQGRFDDALAAFEEYLDRYGDSGILGTAALEGRAAVHEQQRDFIAAGDGYAALAERASDNPTAYARYMMAAVRAYRSEPDWEKAHDAAQRVLDNAPDSPLADQARMAAAEAEERMGGA